MTIDEDYNTVERIRCEGWRRTGGAFSFGPVTWKQCENDAIAMLTVIQEGQEQSFPACNICWKEAIDTKNVNVMYAKPI